MVVIEMLLLSVSSKNKLLRVKWADETSNRTNNDIVPMEFHEGLSSSVVYPWHFRPTFGVRGGGIVADLITKCIGVSRILTPGHRSISDGGLEP